MDDARFLIMRSCVFQLTHWVCKKVYNDLMTMDNHSFSGSDESGSYFVRHRTKSEWEFTVRLNVFGDAWVCVAPEGRKCWRNVRLGRPCQHILLVWRHLLQQKPQQMKLDTIVPSFNKVYRRNHYLTTTMSESYAALPPPPEASTLRVDGQTKHALSMTTQRLQFMVAVTGDVNCVTLEALQELINWKLHGANHDEPGAMECYKRFMSRLPNKMITVPAEPVGPLIVRDKTLDRESNSTRRRRRFDNCSLGGKDLRPSDETLRTEPTGASTITIRELRMHATLRNFKKRGLFEHHHSFYTGFVSDHKIEDLVVKHFSNRPLTLAVDFEWSSNYDPDEHP